MTIEFAAERTGVAEPVDLTEAFEQHYRSLLGTARLLLDDPGAAEDVVQEAFVRFHSARGRLHDPTKAAAYLRTTVLNLARGQLRRRVVARRRPVPPSPDAAGADDAVVAGDERRLVAVALRDLPRRQRECLVLRYFAELSEREIAEALGIAAGSVKSHVSRGMATLTERLEVIR